MTTCVVVQLAGYRQGASLTAQLLFAVLVAMVTGNLIAFEKKLSDVNVAQISNTICFVWICVFLPLSWKRLGGRPATKDVGAGLLDAMRDTWKDAKNYKQTTRYLYVKTML